MRIKPLDTILQIVCTYLVISAGLSGGAAIAAETFCVDGAKEWTDAKDLDGTMWKEKGSDTLRGFLWQPVPDSKFLWKPGTELGLLWSLPDALWTGVPRETIERLKPLQFVTVTFQPAEKGTTATISFERTVVKLTDTGEYRDDLNQTWKYLLQFSDDCLVLSGKITMLKQNDTSPMTASVTLLRDKSAENKQ